MFSTKTSVATLSVVSNASLVAAKIVAGVVTGSVSVYSEAIHSSIDLLAAVIALFAVRMSGRPPDKDHPFGHGKVENISGTVEAALIFVAAAIIIYEAIHRILKGVELEAVGLGIAVMGISVVLNTIVSRQLFRVARATDSMALEADGAHLATDVWTSLGVFLGLGVVQVTGIRELDPLIAIGVALMIIKAAWDITRKSAVDLMDRSLPAGEQERIAAILAEHGGGMVAGYHHIRSRKAGHERHVDLHLVINRSATVDESHAMCDHLEEDLQKELGPAASFTIHVEPCGGDCVDCLVDCSEDAKLAMATSSNLKS